MTSDTRLVEKNSILDKILHSNERLDRAQVLNLILPPREQSYSWHQVNESLQAFNDEVEQIQRDSNDQFDKVLDEKMQEKLKNLSSELGRTQLDVINLQHNIAQTREQFESFKKICNSNIVRDRHELLLTEKNLRQSLQNSRFQSVMDYFDRFLKHLELSIGACKKMLVYSSTNYAQAFEWTHYHRAMFLLRACGKTMIEIDRFERLYQSRPSSLSGIIFKQPIDKMDLNNFIEFQTTYSLESQLDVIVEQTDKQATPTQRSDFNQFSLSPDIASVLNSSNSIEYVLFKSLMEKLGSITVECCQLLIDLNLNYIEAHFTDGINIDKLNGCDSTTPAKAVEQQIMPLYAFSPQEYITQIGQHLLTLRKQTEQFDQIDNRPLRLALEYLQHAHNVHLDVRLCSTVTEIILKCIARHCIRSLIGRTTNSILSKLTPNGRRQLATDAMYLDNVLEDLNLLDSNEPHVDKFKSLFSQ